MHSSNKSKKKNKEVKIKVEKPDIELQPMSHYVDDRVDLIKQVFSTLKSKTIRNLAPDILKKSTIEQIEELCLNEILGISTKRLLSIINATKCPTDTESSSDSDVHNIEEHISLEEISSDTEEEFKKPKKLTKKLKKTTTKSEVKVTEKKDEDDDREISVLELLELQARARAIRSQLAQEPVTKIEVDSDESENVTDDKTKKTSSNAVNKERNSSAKVAQNKQNTSKPSNKETETKIVNGVVSSNNLTEPTEPAAIKNPAKKIKLKRNFRKPQQQDSEENETKDDRTSVLAKENQPEKPSENNVVKVDEKNLKKENISSGTVQTDPKDDDKSDKKDADDDGDRRSQSPDVITILPSPETLFISDSSDDDEGNDKEKLAQTVSTKSPAAVATTTTTVNSTTTFSAKEQSKPVEIEKRKLSQENVIEKENDEKSVEKETEKSKSVPPEELEDGEILDHDENDKEKEKENDRENEKSIEVNKNKSEEKDSNVRGKKKTKKSRNDDNEKRTEKSNEDNQNDDVISLGNDIDYEIRDDLEENQTEENLSVNGMNDKSKSPIQENVSTENSAAVSKCESSGSEHSNSSMINKENKELELDSNKNSPSKNTTKSSDDEEEQTEDEKDEEKEDEDVNEAMDYIELHDSSEDELDTNSQNPDENSQSWNERWLKSHKVKKILAQSRLSNRVRDKIKQNKTNETNKKIIEEQQQQQQLEIVKEKEKFESKFEDGSMQQYREIKEREQTNSNSEKND